ncbi:hypothetical protein RHMOL_Rhmol10G0193300 [Rhododendron molle]|uniref:Uncharacterized protein n=1 Tax=Rhododendron molle TaxID=49168 RepID=A0ACC0M5J5_RHOML|nr:hypothetical protein RHMOL_Rhmol10G0193300 [Rhododendron molle]
MRFLTSITEDIVLSIRYPHSINLSLVDSLPRRATHKMKDQWETYFLCHTI